MAAELEGLEFQIQANSTGAIQHLDELTAKLNGLKSATSNVNGLKKTADAIERLSNAFNGMNGNGVENLSNLATALSGLKISSTVGKNISAIVKSAQALDDATVDRFERLGEALSNMKGIGRIRVPSVGDSNLNTDMADSQVGVSGQAVTATETAMQSASATATTFSQRMSDVGHTLMELFRSSSMAGRGIRTLAQYTVGLPITLGSKLVQSVKGSIASLGQLFSAIKRIALYRLIRTVIKEITQGLREGIQNIYAYSNALGGEFAAAMDSLSTSSLYLKNSLGALAAPILQSLIPAINFAIDRLVALMNVINMFVAALGGKGTATIAKKVETTFGAAGKAAGGAAGSAKKALKDLQNYTLGIDELNIIDDKDKSGGGGGGGGGGAGGIDPSSMFEEVEIDKGISTFANAIRQAIEDQNWAGLGVMLGAKFNHMVNSIKWDEVGKKFGGFVTGIIQTAYYALKTMNFRRLGNGVGDFLNNALDTIDWYHLGGLLVLGFTKIIDFLIGLIERTDFKKVGKAISDFLNGAFDEMTNWLRGKDWREIGEMVTKKIADLLMGIDWEELFITMTTYAYEAFMAKGNFLLGLLFPKKEDVDWTKAGEKFASLTKEGFTKEAKRDKPQFLVDLKNDATEWWNNVKTWWKEKVGKVQEFTTNVKNGASTWWSNVNRWWGEKVSTPVKSFTTNVKNNASEWWSNVKRWWSEKVGNLEIGAAIKNNAQTWWNNVKSWWNRVAGTLTTKFELKLPKVQVTWTESNFLGQKIRIPSLSLKWNAKGAILEGAQIFGALGDKFLGGGEKGREALLPLDQNTGWMDTIASKVRDSLTSFTLDTASDVSLILARLDAIEAQLVGIGQDTKRQADKPENTYVNIGGKTLRDAVTRQTAADGYSFA